MTFFEEFHVLHKLWDKYFPVIVSNYVIDDKRLFRNVNFYLSKTLR